MESLLLFIQFSKHKQEKFLLTAKMSLMLSSMFFRKGWTLEPLAVNMNINLGTRNGWRIDLAKKIMRIFDVITRAIFLNCVGVEASLVQT